MVHIPFDSRTIGYDDHYSPIQIGEGMNGESYHYFRGHSPFQRGYGRQTGGGIGDVLHNLWRFILPYARRAGTAVAKEALDTGGRILEKVSSEASMNTNDSNPSLKQTVISEGKRGIDKLLERGGLPKQFGTGLKARKGSIKGTKKRKKDHLPFAEQNNHQILVGKIPLVKKRKRIDTFGLY